MGWGGVTDGAEAGDEEDGARRSSGTSDSDNDSSSKGRLESQDEIAEMKRKC